MLRLAGGSKGDGNPLTESNDDGVHVGTTQNLQLSLSLPLSLSCITIYTLMEITGRERKKEELVCEERQKLYKQLVLCYLLPLVLTALALPCLPTS